MAHKSREPERLVRAKMTIPRDRGEKYVAPSIGGDEDSGSPWSKSRTPGGMSVRTRRRTRLSRRGEAHELIRKLGAGILRELAKP